ncbi:MAG: hypothetical protein RLZZ543_732 [Bacteroidota bacterium]|jgi:hypothetical protein
MKINTWLLYGLQLLMISSCAQLIVWGKGGHMPRYESNEVIINYAKLNEIDENSLITLSDSSLENQKNRNYNELLIFDNNGYFIDVMSQAEDPRCHASLYSSIGAFGDTTYFPRDSSITISKVSSEWIYLKSKKPYLIKDQKQSLYTVVYYWNTFTGKQENQENVKSIKAQMEKNKAVKIDLILVNEDYREGVILKYQKR